MSRQADATDAVRTGPAATAPGWRRMLTAVLRFQPVRAFTQLTGRGGPMLAAAMAYHSIFAVFAAIWVFFSIAGLWLRTDSEVTDALFRAINGVVPGLIGDGGPISPKALLSGATLSWTGLVALGGLIWKALSWMDSTRKAIRRVFGLDQDARSFVLRKVVDLAVAALFGAILIAAALVSVASSSALDLILDAAGLGPDSFWASLGGRIIGLAVAVALNATGLAFLYRLLSKVRIPWSILIIGSAAAGVVLVVMSGFSGLLLGGAGRNPLLASFAVYIGLLIWFNLIAMMILYGASWMAVAMESRGLSPRTDLEEQQHEREERARARLTLAEAEVADAGAAAAAARWPHRRAARRRLAAAEKELAAVRADADEAVSGTQ